MGGGVAIAAIGMTQGIGESVKNHTPAVVGTFSGNPLVCHELAWEDQSLIARPVQAVEASCVMLRKVMTLEAYKQFEDRQLELVQGCEAIINRCKNLLCLARKLLISSYRFQLPITITTIGAKGCFVFHKSTESSREVKDYRMYKATSDPILGELFWPILLENNVWKAPGPEEEYTLSVSHTSDDISTVVQAFSQYAKALDKIRIRRTLYTHIQRT